MWSTEQKLLLCTGITVVQKWKPELDKLKTSVRKK